MFSKVPKVSCAFSGFWTLTLKLTQHFDLIYNIGKSNWNILREIIKTAQDTKLHHYYKTNCKVSADDASWKISSR